MLKAQNGNPELSNAIYVVLKLIICMTTIGVATVLPFFIASLLLGV